MMIQKISYDIWSYNKHFFLSFSIIFLAGKNERDIARGSKEYFALCDTHVSE